MNSPRAILPLIILIISSALVACSPQPDEKSIQTAIAQTPSATSYPTATPYSTYTPFPTLTPYSTHTPYPTYTLVPPQQVTVFVIVTATQSPTPLHTSTITLVPSPTPIPSRTPIPSPTLSPLQNPKAPGIYLVNVDIAPGIWRNNGTSDKCYWKRADKTGKTLGNHFGQSGGTIYIAPTDFSVTLEAECGTWTYLGQ